MDELFIDRLSEFPFHVVTLHIWEKMLSQGTRFQSCSSFKMRPQHFLISAVLKKNLQCQKWRNLSLQWLRRNFSSLIGRRGRWWERGVGGRPCSQMHVNNGFSVGAFGFGMEWCWEVGECPHLWWAPSRLCACASAQQSRPEALRCHNTDSTVVTSCCVLFQGRDEMCACVCDQDRGNIS